MPTVSIYVPQMMFDEAQKRANEEGISFSKALLGGVKETKPNEQLDRIESKLDRMLNGAKVVPEASYDEWRMKKSLAGFGDEAEIIEKAQAKLEKKRKIPNAIKTVDDVPQWVGGYSKAQQVGKKK